jgi:hypothetical protein
MTSYTNDSKTFWKDKRRELVKDGYSSSVIHSYKSLIKAYAKELGDKGVLDEPSDLSQNRGLSSKQDSDKTHDLNLTSRKPPDGHIILPGPSPTSDSGEKDLIKQEVKVQ